MSFLLCFMCSLDELVFKARVSGKCRDFCKNLPTCTGTLHVGKLYVAQHCQTWEVAAESHNKIPSLDCELILGPNYFKNILFTAQTSHKGILSEHGEKNSNHNILSTKCALISRKLVYCVYFIYRDQEGGTLTVAGC